jgi:hypothetical protein
VAVEEVVAAAVAPVEAAVAAEAEEVAHRRSSTATGWEIPTPGS